MWIVSPRTGWRCGSLRTTGAPPPSIARSRTAPTLGERLAQLAGVDLEGDRLVAAAVDDAGHAAAAAQAPRGARAVGGPRRDLECGVGSAGHERRQG